MKKLKENPNQSKNLASNINNPYFKKQGKPLKEVVPSTNSKYLRENVPISTPSNKSSEGRNYSPFAQPFDIFPEWNEEEAQAFSKECVNNIVNVNSSVIASNLIQNLTEIPEFCDPLHNEIEKNLPLSLLQFCNFHIKWIRPKEYVKNFHIDKEIKMSYPKKNYVKMRVDIKDTYDLFKKALASGNENYEFDIDTLLADDEESRKKNIYKEFYRILDRYFELRVVDYKEREESEEEYKKRKDAEIQEKIRQETLMKSSKRIKAIDSKKGGANLIKPQGHEKHSLNNNLLSINGNHEDRITFKIPNPTNITVSETFRDPMKPINTQSIPTKMMYFNFGKWVGSLFQTIMDLNIHDVFSDKPIWYNIYPQKDNFPIYNPAGRYFIKLYFMGKPRKVEIDDRIPCNSEEEYILPYCGNIEELWPALFTKALMKLNMYKMKYPNYVTDEIGDCSIIYNLTGYIGQTVDLENHNEDDLNFLRSLQEILSDEIYCEKKKFLICYKKSCQLSEDEVLYFHKNSSEEVDPSPDRIMHKRSFKPNSFKDGKKKTIRSSSNPFVDDKFDRGGTRKLSYNNVFLKNMFHVGVHSTSKRSSAQNVYNSEMYQKMIFKDAEESTIQNLGNLYESQSLTTGNSNLYFDFAYSISDFFDNENFNMKRLNHLDFSDLKQELKEFQVSVVYKQLSKEDKKKYISNLIELKNKQKEDKNKRLEELKKEGKKFNLVKIMNESYGNNSLNFYIPYTQEEILMVKKCLLNKWDFPPPSYFEEKYKPYYKVQFINTNDSNNPNRENEMKNKELISPRHNRRRLTMRDRQENSDSLIGIISEESGAGQELRNPKQSSSNSAWNKESYMQLIDHNLEQFNNKKEPVIRQNGGVWIYYPEFKSYFNRFIILHHPNRLYKGQLNNENLWSNWQIDLFEPNEDHSVYVLNHKENLHLNMNENKGIDTDSNMLLLFMPNSEKTFNFNEKIKSYIRFDIVDEDRNVIHDKVILKSFFATFNSSIIRSDKDYYVLIEGGILPFGYFLQILAESHNISNMSHNSYLKKCFGFQSFNLKIEHPTIEKNKFFILSRFSIKCITKTDKPMSVKFTLKYGDKFSKRFFQLVCYKNDMTKKKMFNFNEIIKLKQSGNTYYFVLSVKPEFILGESCVEFECLYDDKDVKVEHYDHIEAYEVYDKFTPNKQGILFKEFIYASDIVHASFGIKLQESKITPKEEQTLPIVSNIRLSSSKERKKSVSVKSLENKLAIYNDVNDKIRLKLVLYKVKTMTTMTPNFDLPKEVICQWEFFNETLIHHVTFEGVPWIEKPPVENKKGQGKDNTLNINYNPNAARSNSVNPSTPPLPYLLVCYLDQSEMPEYMKDLTKNLLKMKNIDIVWSIRIFSTDTLGFVKDTTKEDSEKVLKETWETYEPGRCEKSRKSRMRYLIQTKKEKGTKLSAEEEFLFNEIRERKVSTAPLLEEHKAPAINTLQTTQNKKGNTNKKGETLKVSAGKGNQTNLVPIITNSTSAQEPKKLEINKPLPITTRHISDYIKNFLDYSYNERTIVFDNKMNQINKLIVDNKVKEEKTNKILKENEEYEKYRLAEITLYTTNKSESSEIIKSFYRSSFSFRKEIKEDSTSLIKARDHLKNEFQSKFEIEKNIRDLIANNGIHFDFTHAVYLLKEYQTIINYDEELISQLHITISLKKEESLKAEMKKFTTKDKHTIQKHLEDIESNKLKISADILHKLKELVK